ncbi:MAG: twin-arginine translocation signal domain-containing protein [Myxococcota bacterium]|nr:twin-arginine translocation signal domain-containing protein [Myxococcota bacterium]
MSENSNALSRRGFLKVAAGVAGVSLLGGLGCVQEGGTDGTDEDIDPRDLTIFSPGRLGSVELKNRLVRAATEEAYCTDGIPQAEYLKVMTDLSKGGVGMILCGVATLTEEDSLSFELAAHDDKLLPGLKQIRQAVGAADKTCKLFAQIGHTGHRYVGGLRVGPSDVSWPGDIYPMRALSVAEISAIVNAFAQGARRFQEAGWDGIELHGAHGYLLSTFLSPYTNKRTDSYGGSVQGRVQIIREIMEKTRAAVGPDFPILIKINSDDRGGSEPDDLQGGINKQIFLETAAELDKMGFDGLDVSGNDCVQPGVNTAEKQSYFLDAASALDVSMKVILTGGNRNATRLNSILKTSGADFLGIARPLIREPDLPSKWKTGQATDPKCISCNLCADPMTIITGLRCHQET